MAVIDFFDYLPVTHLPIRFHSNLVYPPIDAFASTKEIVREVT